MALMGVRLTGALAIVLGLIVWTGKVDALVPIHVAIGLLLVLSLWVVAYLAARTGESAALVALVAVWSALTAVLGLTQGGLATGGSHSRGPGAPSTGRGGGDRSGRDAGRQDRPPECRGSHLRA